MNAPAVTFEWRITIGNMMSIATVIAVSAIAWRDLQRNDAEHDRRLEAAEAELVSAGKSLDLLADQPRRILVVEDLARTNTVRLNAIDVDRARLDGRLARLDELMSEVRTALTSFNRRDEP